MVSVGDVGIELHIRIGKHFAQSTLCQCFLSECSPKHNLQYTAKEQLIIVHRKY